MSNDASKLPAMIRALARQPGTFRESSLPPPAAKPPVSGMVGIGRRDAGSGSGIASPLTEQDASTRTYYDPQDVVAEDGTLLTIRPIHTLSMTDANGRSVEFVFAEPDYSLLV